MSRFTILLFALVAACGSTRKTAFPAGNIPLQGEAEEIDRAKTVDAVEVDVLFNAATQRLAARVRSNPRNALGAWCRYYVGEWYLLRGRTLDDGEDLRTARENFHAVRKHIEQSDPPITPEDSAPIFAAVTDALKRLG